MTVAAVALLATSGHGCSGSASDPPLVQGTITATPSVAGIATATVGGSQTVSVSFNASESQALHALRVTSGLSSMPAGWSRPTGFACGVVTTGSGCVLDLTYTPTQADSGTLTIAYD